MNQVDFDAKKFSTDTHGNLIPKQQPKSETVYRGYMIEQKIGRVMVWTPDEDFLCFQPDVKSAKTAIDTDIENQ